MAKGMAKGMATGITMGMGTIIARATCGGRG
jgi:hypothetical protein